MHKRHPLLVGIAAAALKTAVAVVALGLIYPHLAAAISSNLALLH